MKQIHRMIAEAKAAHRTGNTTPLPTMESKCYTHDITGRERGAWAVYPPRVHLVCHKCATVNIVGVEQCKPAATGDAHVTYTCRKCKSETKVTIENWNQHT